STMTAQTIKEMLSYRPFEPFRIVMSSGQSYDVRHPEMAMVTQGNVLVGTGSMRGGVPASFKICALLHVAAVEPLGADAPETQQRD
ncbi:MAG: hypothetical protein ACRDD1_19210, partial [Planctomycetia bacterium]